VPVSDVGRFESELLDEIGRSRAGIYDAIRETGDLSDDTVNALKDVIGEFRQGFETGSGELLVRDEPEEPLAESDVQQETVKRRVPKPDDGK
jgi:F-type H+/Na+-transporting ATPase subunit alpha